MWLGGFGFLAVVVGCGGSSAPEVDDSSVADTTAVAVVSTTAPPPTTTELPAATAPTTTLSEEEALDLLAIYLADTAELSSQMLAQQATATSPAEIASIWLAFSDELDRLDRPSAADEYYQQWGVLLDLWTEYSDELESGDSSIAARALEEFPSVLARMGTQLASLVEAETELTLSVLTSRGDPVSAYSARLIELGRESGPLLERLFAAMGALSGSPDQAALDELLDVVEAIETATSRWGELDPPPELAGFHATLLEQQNQLAWIVGVFRTMIETETLPPADMQARLEDYVVRAPVIAGDSARRIAAVLRGNDLSAWSDADPAARALTGLNVWARSVPADPSGFTELRLCPLESPQPVLGDLLAGSLFPPVAVLLEATVWPAVVDQDGTESMDCYRQADTAFAGTYASPAPPNIDHHAQQLFDLIADSAEDQIELITHDTDESGHSFHQICLHTPETQRSYCEVGWTNGTLLLAVYIGGPQAQTANLDILQANLTTHLNVLIENLN